jgi:hypothetical protein
LPNQALDGLAQTRHISGTGTEASQIFPFKRLAVETVGLFVGRMSGSFKSLSRRFYVSVQKFEMVVCLLTKRRKCKISTYIGFQRQPLLVSVYGLWRTRIVEPLARTSAIIASGLA